VSQPGARSARRVLECVVARLSASKAGRSVADAGDGEGCCAAWDEWDARKPDSTSGGKHIVDESEVDVGIESRCRTESHRGFLTLMLDGEKT